MCLREIRAMLLMLFARFFFFAQILPWFCEGKPQFRKCKTDNSVNYITEQFQ